MRTQHEENDCRGVPGLTVILTDADGTEWEMPGNSVGNFWLDADVKVAMPYTARIVDRSGRERVKQQPVSMGIARAAIPVKEPTALRADCWRRWIRTTPDRTSEYSV